MKKFLKKFFFPFAVERYKFLENKWGHKLIKAIFVVWIISCAFFLRQLEPSTNIDCSPLFNNGNNEKFTECIKYNLNSGTNLLISFGFIIINYYFLQIFYFKIIIYIIYGKKKK